MNQNLLKTLLNYNKDTGEFTWLLRPTDMFNSERACKSWNTRYCNNIAGTSSKFNGKSYIVIRIFSKQYLAHRLAWLYMTGEWPDEIDHGDGDGLNNKWDNINNVTHGANCKNLKLTIRNTSGVMGVHWCKRDKLWVSRLHVSNETISLGYFKDFFEAVCARKSAENHHGFHVNHGSIRPL